MFPSARKQRLVSEARLDGAGFRGCGWGGGGYGNAPAYASYGANVIPMHTRMHTRVLAHTWSRHGVTVARAPSSSLPCGTHVSHTCTSLQCIQMLQAEFTLRIVDRRGLYRRGSVGGKGLSRFFYEWMTSCPRIGQEFLSCDLISSVIWIFVDILRKI